MTYINIKPDRVLCRVTPPDSSNIQQKCHQDYEPSLALCYYNCVSQLKHTISSLNSIGTINLNSIGTINLNSIGSINLNYIGTINLNSIGSINLNSIGSINLNSIGSINLNSIGSINHQSVVGGNCSRISSNSGLYFRLEHITCFFVSRLCVSCLCGIYHRKFPSPKS